MPPEIVRHNPLGQDLPDVNWEVNHGATYMTDQEQYGVPEKWAEISPAGFGDCEDYALTKMKKLRALGWPQGSLDIGCCTASDGSGHAVLIAHTTRGDIVLDNNSDTVFPWKLAPYAWVCVSVGGDFLNWHSVAV